MAYFFSFLTSSFAACPQGAQLLHIYIDFIQSFIQPFSFFEVLSIQRGLGGGKFSWSDVKLKWGNSVFCVCITGIHERIK